MIFLNYLDIVKKSKIIRGLTLLSREQRASFRLMLQSPYFDIRPQALSLFDYVESLGDDEEPDEKKAFQAIYKDLAFDKQKLKDAQSWLFKSLMQFLSLQEIEEQPYLADSFSLRQLRKMKGGHLFGLQKNALHRKLEQENAEATDSWFDALLDLFEESDQMAALTQGRPDASGIEAAITALDARYATRKLRALCELQNRYNIHGGEPPAVWAEELVHEPLPQAVSEVAPAVSLYEKILIFLKDASREDAFEKLVVELNKKAALLSVQEARAMYTHAQNFCIARINQGESVYLNRLLELFVQQLESEVLLDKGYLSYGNFTNIVTAALRLGKASWVQEFMDDYRDKLPEQQRETVFLYNRANLLYQTRQLRKAMKELQIVEFADGFYAMSAKLLLCRVYYELEEDDLLSYQLAAFQRFLQRSRSLSARHRLPYSEFLRFLKKLQKLRERSFLLKSAEMNKRKESLSQKIDHAESLALRKWMLEKVTEL